jgi:hypothetical protein
VSENTEKYNSKCSKKTDTIINGNKKIINECRININSITKNNWMRNPRIQKKT